MIANGRPPRGGRHPSRWRPFTWFLLDVEAFLLGSLLGWAVGYNTLPTTLTSDQTEGAAVLGIGLIFIIFLVTAVLGVVWILTALIARRRATEQPVRRGVWMTAVVALAAGALVAGGPCLSSYRG